MTCYKRLDEPVCPICGSEVEIQDEHLANPDLFGEDCKELECTCSYCERYITLYAKYEPVYYFYSRA